MARVLVLYYSMYGHVETMAGAVAEGARGAGASVTVKRVAELVPREVLEKSGARLDQAAPEASPQELDQYDAIIVGCPTRYGRMAAQMAQFGARPAGSGRAARWSARSAAPSPPPPPSMAGRRRR